MKVHVILALAAVVAQGCRPAPQSPPPAHPSPTPSTTTNTPAAADDRTLQTLRDLGVTPEVMLQLVRNQLASVPPSAPAASQPPPADIGQPPVMPAAPPPVATATEPAAQVPAPAAPNADTTAVTATPPPRPPTEWPNGVVPNQPAVAADGAAGAGAAPQAAPPADAVVVQQPVEVQQAQDFYTPLNNFGAWVDLPAYGRVWQPTITSVNANWRPYCDGGRWVYTDCGWYWQSDYSWGWAAFHYGRWSYVDRYRWVWVPDTVWAPAWVSWRRTDTQCGWAPLPPGTTFRVGVGINAGYDVAFDAHFGITSRHYTFVATSHFCDRDLVHVLVDAGHADEVYRRSTFIAGSHVWSDRDRRVHNDGPGRDWSERVVAAPIHPVAPASPTFARTDKTPAPVALLRNTEPTTPAKPTAKTVSPVAWRAPALPASTGPAQPDMPALTPSRHETKIESPALPTPPISAKPAATAKWHAPEPVATHDVPAPVAPVMKPVRTETPFVTAPSTHDTRAVETHIESHDTHVEPITPPASRRVDATPPATVVTPRTDMTDRPTTRAGIDATHTDSGDDPRGTHTDDRQDGRSRGR